MGKKDKNKDNNMPDESVVVDPKAVEQILAEPVEEEKEPEEAKQTDLKEPANEPEEAGETSEVTEDAPEQTKEEPAEAQKEPEVKETAEPEAKEEAKPEEPVNAAEPEVKEEAEPEEPVKAAEPEVKEETKPVAPEETKPEVQETTDETVILTDQMKEALAKQEDEEIVDAKIRTGLNEAAEDFKVAQEIDNTGEDIAKEVEQKRPKAAPDPEKSEPKYSYHKKEGTRTMNDNMEKETAEIKTVYVKEKQRTGWWKIVMLILTILIVLAFGATALFTGIGVWQLNRIAENKEQTQTQYQIPANDGYDYYGGGSYDGYGSYYGQNPNSNYNGNYGGSYYGEDDIDLDDIFDYFYSHDSSSNGTGNENVADDFYSDYGYGDSYSADAEDDDSWGAFSDWLTELFGGSDSTAPSTQGNNQQF